MNHYYAYTKMSFRTRVKSLSPSTLDSDPVDYSSRFFKARFFDLTVMGYVCTVVIKGWDEGVAGMVALQLIP